MSPELPQAQFPLSVTGNPNNVNEEFIQELGPLPLIREDVDQVECLPNVGIGMDLLSHGVGKAACQIDGLALGVFLECFAKRLLGLTVPGLRSCFIKTAFDFDSTPKHAAHISDRYVRFIGEGDRPAICKPKPYMTSLPFLATDAGLYLFLVNAIHQPAVPCRVLDHLFDASSGAAPDYVHPGALDFCPDFGRNDSASTPGNESSMHASERAEAEAGTAATQLL
jgi:hypothetical protein